MYHPEFHGSFSLKYILHPLVPRLTYDDLIIVDGMVASAKTCTSRHPNPEVTDAVVNGLAANIDELGELARLTTGGRTGL